MGDGDHGQVTGDDVVSAVDGVADMLAGVGDDHPGWERPAGPLRWRCRSTLAHVADCLVWYAANLARHSTASVEAPEAPLGWPPSQLVDTLRSCGAVLATAVWSASPDDRGWHPYGVADRSGFAAMGCDEVLVHAWDLAQSLGPSPAEPLDFAPRPDLCERLVRRLFPWTPEGHDPLTALLWANGRASLPGLDDTPPGWVWHCAPLAEWDGSTPHAPATG